MKKQISHISILQSSKVVAALYAALSVILVPIGIISVIVGGKARIGGLVFILAPVFYGVLGFLFAALGAWLYNLIASRLGGVEFEVRDDTSAP